MQKFIVVEPRGEGIAFSVYGPGVPPIEVTTYGFSGVLHEIRKHGIPRDQVLVVCEGLADYRVCESLRGRPVRLSSTWATGVSFGRGEQDTYINTADKPDDTSVCQWVVQEYNRYLKRSD